ALSATAEPAPVVLAINSPNSSSPRPAAGADAASPPVANTNERALRRRCCSGATPHLHRRPENPAMTTLPYTVGNCTYLDGNTPCGALYQGYPVYSNYGGSYTNYDEFVTLFNLFNDTSYIEQSLEYKYNCTAGSALDNGVASLRYQMSYLCAKYIYQGILSGCPVLSKEYSPYGPLICQDQCTLSYQSEADVIEDTDICTDNTDAKARTSSSTSVCDMFNGLKSANGGCLTGITVDTNNCGFRTPTDAATFCPSLASSDSCCASLVASAASTTSKSATSSSTAAASSSSSSSSASMVGPIVGAVVGVLVVALAAIGIFIFIRRRNAAKGGAAGAGPSARFPSSSDPYNRMYTPSGSLERHDGGGSSAWGPPVPKDMQRDAFGPGLAAASTAPFVAAPPQASGWQDSMQRRQQQQASLERRQQESLERRQHMQRLQEQQQQQMQQASYPPQPAAALQAPQHPQAEPEDIFNAPSSIISSIITASAAPTASVARESTLSSISSSTSGTSRGEALVRVVHPYAPTLADELLLEVGREVILLKAFDDGWALGMNPVTGQQGAFPLVCVADPAGDDSASVAGRASHISAASSAAPRLSNRVSSALFSQDDLDRLRRSSALAAAAGVPPPPASSVASSNGLFAGPAASHDSYLRASGYDASLDSHLSSPSAAAPPTYAAGTSAASAAAVAAAARPEKTPSAFAPAPAVKAVKFDSGVPPEVFVYPRESMVSTYSDATSASGAAGQYRR
ncbi:hypothetical protein HK405_010173, partial [Cladochytrium tenue]